MTCTALCTALALTTFLVSVGPVCSFRLNMVSWNWGKKNDLPSTPIKLENDLPSSKTAAPGYKLEKISTKQNRDYNAEQAAVAAAAAPPVIRDMQKKSTPDGFPNLYKGWIKADGDQIAKQIIKSSNSALKAKEKYIEVLFDPVPNLDEVAFGTVWNKKFRKEIVANLKVPEYAANRGGPSILEWSNLYWANRLSDGIKGTVKKPIILLAYLAKVLRAKISLLLSKV